MANILINTPLWEYKQPFRHRALLVIVGMDIYYDNQRLFCEQKKLPLFAYTSCNHMYNWVRGEQYGKLQTLGEMLIEKYGEEEAFKVSTSSHIISCPSCSRSWCD